MKILILCPFPYGVAAGQRLKFEQYYKDWVNHGHSICIRSFMSKSLWQIVYKEGYTLQKIFRTLLAYARRLMIFFEIHEYDLVYVHMWVDEEVCSMPGNRAVGKRFCVSRVCKNEITL